MIVSNNRDRAASGYVFLFCFSSHWLYAFVSFFLQNVAYGQDSCALKTDDEVMRAVRDFTIKDKCVPGTKKDRESGG